MLFYRRACGYRHIDYRVFRAHKRHCPEGARRDATKVYKSSAFDPLDWKHVATIHGWANDLCVCHEIMEFLNSQSPGGTFVQELD